MASSQLKVNLYGPLAVEVTRLAGHRTAETGQAVSAAKVVADALYELWGNDLSQMPHNRHNSSDRGSDRATGAMTGQTTGASLPSPGFNDLFSAQP